MTNAELDTMWFQAQHDAIKAGEDFTRYRFAALVTAAERERIISANAPEIERINSHIKELEAAVMAEREACAKVCEDITAAWTQPVYNGACMDCAAAIRARGNK